MPLRADQLEAQLARSLAPLYLIHGDEPLLALEAADAVRAAARKRGFAEREVLFVQQRFDWSAFVQATESLSLFGARKLVDLRIPTAKPGTEGGGALQRYAARPNPELVLLVTMPRPEGSGWWKSAWFTALDAAGVVVEAKPVLRAQLPAWIGARLARQGQCAPHEVLEFLAERVEGNLLAAHQEVQKLGLLAPQGMLAMEQVAGAVANVARFEFEVLAEALCAGEFARYCRALDGLRGEGESPAALAWRLGEELVTLLRIRQGMAAGRRLDQLFAEHRVWRAAQPRAEKALRRLALARLQQAVRQLARIERQSKGVGAGDPWDGLMRLGLELIDGTEGARKIG